MQKNKSFILWFDGIGVKDIPLVGGKCANLGEMIRKVNVPILPGFAITSYAYKHFIEYADLDDFIRKVLKGLNTHNLEDLSRRGKLIRKRMARASMSEELRNEILRYYHLLGRRLKTRNPYVSVRSSATAEDLPKASFAGQQDTYLNVRRERDLIKKTKLCFASLFTDRAISYRKDHGFDHFKVSMSIGIQKMGRADTGSAGVMFTIDPDSGFENVVSINGSYGLGEYVVKGNVTPDEFIIFKPTMKIIEKKLGDKRVKLVRGRFGNTKRSVSMHDWKRFCLNDRQIMELAEYAIRIEKYYKKPMDIEWLLEGNGKLYITQARPETVHTVKNKNILEDYTLLGEGRVLVTGAAVGRKIGSGKVNILKNTKSISRFKKGEILVTDMTDPDWEPIMKIASGIVTNKGGVTSHAAIVSRELGIPCVIGTGNATKVLRNDKGVTIDCSTGLGKVYSGILKFKIIKKDIRELKKTRTQIMINLGNPDRAFSLAQLPVDGVGLARQEFIISSYVNAHPLYLLEKGEGEKYVNALVRGIAKIAAAFYPRPVIVRLSDFKSDEYANLKGGKDYEPKEDNPMIGWRGASRYYDKSFLPAFELECKALKKVRDELKLKNVILMVPFCRTVEEGKKVLKEMKRFGLSGFKFYVMAEIPSNIVLAEEFSKIFNGFSIGSNDLTQLTLGLDRNSERLSSLFDERNEAVKRLIHDLIKKAHKHKRVVGICGEAPSNYPEFTKFLVKCGIDSISVEPDMALRTIILVSKVERSIKNRRS